MINLGMISGPRYIEAVIERIHLTKSQFILDLEQGNEVIIPKEINQDFLPASYRYYDSILLMIQENITLEQKNFQKMKNKLGSVFE